ncbi:unnamed protein product [Rotaria socialis]|uniref:Uncharacterized protein n=1 Tax=Rotaria socialis TaxID=392032 RepID=A0A818XHV5_9BILA|nr:unnamed protein product [Rotaria socialis]
MKFFIIRNTNKLFNIRRFQVLCNLKKNERRTSKCRVCYVILSLFNITYASKPDLQYSNVIRNSTNSSISTPLDDYYDHYYYDTSDARQHKMNINSIFLFVIFVYCL